MSRPSRRPWSIVACLAVVLTIAGCSGSSVATLPPTASPATDSPATSAAPSAAASTPDMSPSSPAASVLPPSSAGAATVELTFTGSKAFTAIGSAGRCILVSNGGTTNFAFEATEADYPGLGVSFSLAETINGLVDVKWLLDAQTAYSFPDGMFGTPSTDHHSVRLDGDLTGMAAAGVKRPGPEHVSGTVSCP